jgi:hypothetical protein
MAINECPMKNFPRTFMILLVIVEAILAARWLGWIGR